MTFLLEHWKPIPHFEELYEVSNCGNIRNVHGRLLRPYGVGGGYLAVALCKNRKHYRKVHALVAASFVGPRPHSYDVNHVNGWKRNNRASNLEYLTRSDNIRHAWRIGLNGTHGRGCPPRKLSDDDVRHILENLHAKTDAAIAAEVGVSHTMVWRLRNGYRHKSAFILRS